MFFQNFEEITHNFRTFDIHYGLNKILILIIKTFCENGDMST